MTRSTYARCQGERGADSTCLDAHCFHLLNKILPKDPIAVAQQITGCSIPRKRIPKLLHRPLGCGMSGDAKLENAPTVVRQHQEDVKHLKPQRRYGEEVHRDHALDVIVQECSPRL